MKQFNNMQELYDHIVSIQIVLENILGEKITDIIAEQTKTFGNHINTYFRLVLILDNDYNKDEEDQYEYGVENITIEEVYKEMLDKVLDKYNDNENKEQVDTIEELENRLIRMNNLKAFW